MWKHNVTLPYLSVNCATTCALVHIFCETQNWLQIIFKDLGITVELMISMCDDILVINTCTVCFKRRNAFCDHNRVEVVEQRYNGVNGSGAFCC